MSSSHFVVSYVQSCTAGTLGPSECGPIWQLLVIGALLVISVVALLVIRLRAHPSLGSA